MKVHHNVSHYRRSTQNGQVKLTPKTGGDSVSVKLIDQGVEVRGDGFDHTIRVDGKEATISSHRSEGNVQVGVLEDAIKWLTDITDIGSSRASVCAGLSANEERALRRLGSICELRAGYHRPLLGSSS